MAHHVKHELGLYSDVVLSARAALMHPVNLVDVLSGNKQAPRLFTCATATAKLYWYSKCCSSTVVMYRYFRQSGTDSNRYCTTPCRPKRRQLPKLVSFTQKTIGTIATSGAHTAHRWCIALSDGIVQVHRFHRVAPAGDASVVFSI